LARFLCRKYSEGTKTSKRELSRIDKVPRAQQREYSNPSLQEDKATGNSEELNETCDRSWKEVEILRSRPVSVTTITDKIKLRNTNPRK
jgi:hypothetical protein